jgi:DNA-directed RNA polymerase subunit RPC12/RpoP
MTRYEYKCRDCRQVTPVDTVGMNPPDPKDVRCKHCESDNVFRKYGVGRVWHPTHT